jgi:hypothetical protein
MPPRPPKPPDREPSPRHKQKRHSQTEFETAIVAVRRLSDADPTPDDVAQYQQEAGAERGDRGAAILFATDLENTLQLAIIRMLQPASKQRAELFGHNAPMGTFAYKITIAHAIGIFGDVTRKNLDIIRTIRNAFAHARRPIRFTDDKISALCNYLVIPRVRRLNDFAGPISAEEKPGSPAREKYHAVCINLSCNFLVHNYRARFSIAPEGINFQLQRDYEVWATDKPLP